ncbi:MAG: helix-turn-helix transcriptional regulator [Candidatus Cloacimonetes bacterium]|nr:helix-turn-helix transcriptional regulator [Candidatus Cloacimonadota bacterium]
MGRQEEMKKMKLHYIVEKAEEVFREKGYETVTMDDIADACEYTKKTIYTYITSKEELYVLVYIKGMKMRLEFLQAAVEQEQKGFCKLKALAIGYYGFYKTHPYILKHQLLGDVGFITEANVNDEVADELNHYNKLGVDMVRDIVRLGLEDKTLNSKLDWNLWYSFFLYTIRMNVSRVLSGYVRLLDSEEITTNVEEWYKYNIGILLKECAAEKDAACMKDEI